MEESTEKQNQKDVDIYRDTPVRLLGYANEVGEAFRALVPVRLVHLSYGVASAYVLADTYDKSARMSQRNFASGSEKKKKVAAMAADTLIWQALASVMIPGLTINRICALSLFTLSRTSKLPLNAQKWLTTAIGLSCIPFIVKPIDTLVDKGMDSSIRKLLGTLQEHEHGSAVHEP